MKRVCVQFIRVARVAPILALAGLVSCNPAGVAQFLTSNTAALGGDSVLENTTDTANRGAINVAIQNNTPFFVTATFGAFDPLNENLAPSFEQLISTSETPDQTLGPFETSDVAVLVCSRTVSLGGSTLIDAIQARDPLAPDDLQAGITFSTRLTDDPEAETFTVNNLPDQAVELAVDYQCESLVFYELNEDESQPSGIRIDVTVLLP